MKILIATPLYPPDIGGPAKYARHLREEFATRGNGGGAVAYGTFERTLPPLLRHIVYFFRLLPQAFRADVIFALDTWSVGLPALLVAKLLRKKFLVRIGGDVLWEAYVERTGELITLSEFYAQPRTLTYKEKLMKWSGALLMRRADALLFNTAWQRDIWRSAYGAGSEALVVENHFPTLAKTEPEGEERVVVAAGRHIRFKNIDAFARAFKRVKSRHQHLSLDTTPLSPEKNRARLSSCYAVAVPSVSEVNSNLIMEGLSFGKPFITARDSGMHEKFEGMGFFVDTRSEPEMEQALEKLLDEKEYQTLVERIRTSFKERSWSEVADEVLEAARAL